MSGRRRHDQLEHRLEPEVVDSPVREEAGSDAQPATCPTLRTHAGARGPTEPSLPLRYADRGAIGKGGCAEVRRVYDRTMDCVVAMKILRFEHMDSESLLRRFINEARVNAFLAHPGIAPVHDRGELADGRPWFTMKEVRGQTFEWLIARLAEQPGSDGSGWNLRRAVEAFLRVCQTVGYAHAQGLIHRDLKPQNLMVGEFGEVLVMDWGIARWLREDGREIASRPNDDDVPEAVTRLGDALGTVAYMSPEQARGDLTALGPSSDVFALGLVLWELLEGRRAYRGSGSAVWAQAVTGVVPPLPAGEHPDELVAACARATARAPEQRYASASELAVAIGAWLDGQARRARCEVLLGKARAMEADIEALRARRDDVRRRAAVARRGLQSFDPVERKRPTWALEDAVVDVEQALEVKEAERVEALHAALELDADHPSVHAALADFYRQQVLEAEERRDPRAAIRSELQLKRHDRGRHSAFLQKRGSLTILTDPPGAYVRVRRWVERERRLVLGDADPLGRTPLRTVGLLAGSYVLELHAEGFECVRHPVSIRRDEDWRAVPPGESEPLPVALPPRGVLGPDDLYVPAGPAQIGGDPLATEALPSHRPWFDAFVIRRFPVTNAEYLAFLDALRRRGAEDEALAHAPRRSLGRDPEGEPALAVERGRDGSFALGEERPGTRLAPEWPVALITWHGAMAYAAWLSGQTGKAWRLPDELEWEKAARGVDGRAFPWGDHPEPTYAAMLGSSTEPPGRRPIGAHPTDESPYGARDMAGNVRCWCSNAWHTRAWSQDEHLVVPAAADPRDPALRAIRGGAWSTGPTFSRAAGRFANAPSERLAVVGIRLVSRPWF